MPAPPAPARFAFGDPHGHLEPLLGHLRAAGLIGADDRWCGADAELVIVGDFVDRGPAGVEAIRFARRLEREAAAAGGRADSLLGNHDLLLLAARAAPGFVTGKGGTLHEAWLESGGRERDLAGLDDEHAAWLAGLPWALRRGDALLLHADGALYLGLGRSVAELNRTGARVAAGRDPAAMDALLDAFGEHHGFVAPGGERLLARTLARFGGRRVIHGHTPLQKDPEHPDDRARVTHGGRCVNVDGGLYRGGPGFLFAF